MTELLAVITPLLLIDALNPVLFALLIYAAGTARPVANSSAIEMTIRFMEAILHYSGERSPRAKQCRFRLLPQHPRRQAEN